MFTMFVYAPLQSRYSCDVAHFDEIMALTGEVYRAVKTRKTLRVLINDRAYFAKLHWATGWREIFKNLLQGRLPVIGAKQEYRAIRHLEAIGVATMHVVAFGERYANPARRESFLLTEELIGVQSLHDLTRTWKYSPPRFSVKCRYVEALARCVRAMHDSGLNHRDCYLVHFYWRAHDETMVVIDLHRAQLRKRVPLRWRVKDLAGLYFSSLDVGLTSKEYYRFLKIYTGLPLRECVRASLWKKVMRAGLALYEREKVSPRG